MKNGYLILARELSQAQNTFLTLVAFVKIAMYQIFLHRWNIYFAFFFENTTVFVQKFFRTQC